ncbi:MAG: AAA family ATPase [Nitrospira sp. SB0662_bin_26]|nr:AAA family ATPase [Nitrospira sp. SB0662_bin_26]
MKKEGWKYLLEHSIQTDLDAYTKKKKNLNKAIESLNQRIVEKNSEKSQKELEIKNLEKDTTSIQPTIEAINYLIKSSGFQGFTLAKAKEELFYEIQRPDGTDAKETLSEGEKNFIAFLYFYHLIKGSESESGMTTNRVIVFDDPVSSLDSNILFIVSSLIRDLFDEVRTSSGTIKQIFVLTHNVYFHREVTFNPKRDADKKLNEETFWMLTKSGQQSKIRGHNTNPIKTSYELLWMEVRNADYESPLSIQNTLRRILEYYFQFLGNVNPDDIWAKFEGKEKLICRSLFSWVSAGSHSVPDDLYAPIDEAVIDTYLNVFKRIFEKTNHIAHYKMMMGEG